jgi:uncharacterized repeat protein (TIGR03803 family)
LVRDAAGNLYGTTNFGGASDAGVVFKLSPAGTEAVLHTFTAGADGGYPFAGLVRDAAGNLYGTTWDGGASGYGVVFKLGPSGTETLLHSFTGPNGNLDGAAPYAGLIQDAGGNLYGTATFGGAHDYGVVFELIRCDSAPTGYDFKVLYTFTGADGGQPVAGLIRDAAGNLYGTTTTGGSVRGDAGVVFKLSASGTETVLHSFAGPPTDGYNPLGGLIRDGAGNLYGTTAAGGASNAGVVFKLSPTGSETVLHTFTGGADGGAPFAGLIQDAAGNLYGTTSKGGADDDGVVFRLTP